MSSAHKLYFKNIFRHVFLITVIFLLKLNCVQQNKHNFIESHTEFFRFHNFQPREVLALHAYNDNGTLNEPYVKKLRYETTTISKRAGRGFHIQATDQDLTVEMEFIIPFVRVPIMRSRNFITTSLRKLLNLHTGALIWSGAFIVVGAIVVGTINTLFALRPALQTGFFRRDVEQSNLYENWQRNENNVDTENIANFVDTKLEAHNISLKSCVQRFICRYVRKTANIVRSGKASSLEKIFDGVLRTQLLHQFMGGTALHKAIEAGQQLKCDALEKQCRIPKFNVMKMFKNFY